MNKDLSLNIYGFSTQLNQLINKYSTTLSVDVLYYIMQSTFKEVTQAYEQYLQQLMFSQIQNEQAEKQKQKEEVPSQD